MILLFPIENVEDIKAEGDDVVITFKTSTVPLKGKCIMLEPGKIVVYDSLEARDSYLAYRQRNSSEGE